MCDGGYCINGSLRCDGSNDCHNDNDGVGGDDELDCYNDEKCKPELHYIVVGSAYDDRSW